MYENKDIKYLIMAGIQSKLCKENLGIPNKIDYMYLVVGNSGIVGKAFDRFSIGPNGIPLQLDLVP